MLKCSSYPDMKPRFTYQRNRALTFIEVLVIILCLAVLAAIILPMLAAAKHRNSRINCVSNLKQINLALRIWEGDNNNEYPMQVAVTNGGGKEWIETGDIAACFRAASNELSTTRILICPLDTDHTYATNFQTDFNNSHISYFLCPNASESYPQMILSGDDNLAVNGTPVPPGILNITNCSAISWTKARHGGIGNLAFADGSVAEESSSGFQNALQYATNGTPFMTKRLAIP